MRRGEATRRKALELARDGLAHTLAFQHRRPGDSVDEIWANMGALEYVCLYLVAVLEENDPEAYPTLRPDAAELADLLVDDARRVLTRESVHIARGYKSASSAEEARRGEP